MRIFISSVRRGLELERDALPGLISALGHEPVRFEDFTAQSTPSREACIRGVESSDAYLLLLGPQYGYVFPETGQSATHDEWVAAQRAGKPRYVFRKSGVEFEAEQQAFDRDLADYGSGRFHKAFTGVTELQQAVAAVLRELESKPSLLSFEPMRELAAVPWLTEGGPNNLFSATDRCLLEIHIIPFGGRPISTRLLEQVRSGLPAHVRNAGLASESQALDSEHIQDGVALAAPSPPRLRESQNTRDGSFAGMMVFGNGGITVAFRLPGDMMGTILNTDDAAHRIAAALRLAGRADITEASRFAVGVGLTSSSMVSLGTPGERSRDSAGMKMTTSPIRVEPDETVNRAGLDHGADEVASSLAHTLIRAFQNTT